MKALSIALFAMLVFLLSMMADTMVYGTGFIFWTRDPETKKIHWNWPGTGRFFGCLGLAAVITVVREVCATWARALEAQPPVALASWVPWVALAGLVLMLAGIVNYGIWWHVKTGARFRELAVFSLMSGILTLVAMLPAAVVASAITSAFWASVVANLPLFIAIIVGGYMWVSYLFYLGKTADEKKKRRVFTWLGRILAALTAIGLILSMIFLPAWPKREKAEETPAAPTETHEEPTTPAPAQNVTITWKFYHDQVILDNYDANGNPLTGDELAEALLNDYDFGTDLVNEVVRKKIAAGTLTYEQLMNCSDQSDLIKLKIVTVEEVKEEMYERLRNDPTYLAAVALWWDVTFHTNHLGEFIVTLEGEHAADAMELANYAAAWWMANPEQFTIAAERFIEEMEHSNEIRFRYIAKGITDQMYMDGIWVGEKPTIVVKESADQSGWVIEFVRYIKPNERTNNEVVAGYRLNCGGQPYNVAEILGIEPQENPNKTSTPPSSGGTPPKSNGSQGGNPPQQQQGTQGGNPPQQQQGTQGGGTPIVDWSPKDTSRGTQPADDTLPNDDPGITGDPPTMSDDDPFHSTAEVPMNTGNGMNISGHNILIGDLGEANEVANRHESSPDPNTGRYTPSYTPVGDEAKDGGPTFYSNETTGQNGIGGGIDVIAPVDQSATGNIVDTSGNDTSQTGTATDGVNLFWGADMSR